MSDSLNEALERHGLTVAGQKRRGLRTYEGDEGALLRADDAGLIRSAARQLAAGTLPADFPSDEDVEVAAEAWKEARQSPIVNLADARAALQAVADARRTEEE